MDTQLKTSSKVRTKAQAKTEVRDVEQERRTWVQTVNRLLDQITEWTAANNWTVERKPRDITEEILGAYSVSDAIIRTPDGQLMLEVKARGVPEAAGRVELSAWPTLYRVMLLHRADDPDWIIYTDSGISLRQPWIQETFLTLCQDLMAAL